MIIKLKKKEKFEKRDYDKMKNLAKNAIASDKK